jgi:hypothetical protein
MKLTCGTEVFIQALYVDGTYSGLLCGHPSDELNDEMIQWAQESVQKLWNTRKIHVVPPEVEVVEEEFDEHKVKIPWMGGNCIKVWLNSHEAQRGDGTELVVIIFTNEDIYRKPLEEIIYEKIKDLDWNELSEEWSF